MEFNPELERGEYIDRYLRGELAEAERIAFERKIQEDAALAEDVERVRSVRSLLRNYGLRQNLRAIHTRKMAEKHSRSSLAWFNSVPMRIAAGIVLLLVSAFVIRTATLQPESLYTKVEIYEPAVVRGEEIMPHSPRDMMRMEYASGNYNNVVRLFGQMRSHSIEDIFLASNAWLALSQPAKAIGGFQQVMLRSSQTGDYTYYRDAEYYLAWAYLKNNQINEAEALFSKIHQSATHPFHRKVGTWLYWQVKLLKWKRSS